MIDAAGHSAAGLTAFLLRSGTLIYGTEACSAAFDELHDVPQVAVEVLEDRDGPVDFLLFLLWLASVLDKQEVEVPT